MEWAGFYLVPATRGDLAKEKLAVRDDGTGSLSLPGESKTYSTWEQLAGYFDGDGSVSILIWKFVVSFYLDFADQCREQLEQIVAFLRSQGIRTGIVRKMSSSAAYFLRIADQESVAKIAESVVRFCFKKRAELRTLLEYRKYNLITGSEVQMRFARYVETGFRERHGKRAFIPMPWAFSVGYRRSRMGARRDPRKRWPVLSEAQKQEARVRHNVFGETITALGLFYGVSRMAMWRILKK